MLTHILAAAAVLVLLLLAVLAATGGSLEKRSQRCFALFAMGLFPCLWLLGAIVYDLQRMTTVDFCATCHTMDGYRESMEADDEDSLVSNHYLNNRVPRHAACYECHADHTPISGPIKTKLNGLREAFIEYFGETEMPLKAAKPFTNANCLHCHEGARNFEGAHEDALAELHSGEMTCMECHDVAHVLPEKKHE